ncbi:hypothetical protein Bache_3327 [Bacteroides helcogenes P 36-108]|uniref:Uncharacterized protein n=1 Tax=Bacteroides helcogenes (strain ATCC 35417 / DSM 20613 / JCM 6297 / CCUG 15421 / P 36-108) TaxID=693979 RepID=E6ST46_BACT6|nr:hypothetical protein Bache_3327 [Bacteroides helcogenes P 36-108]
MKAFLFIFSLYRKSKVTYFLIPMQDFTRKKNDAYTRKGCKPIPHREHSCIDNISLLYRTLKAPGCIVPK